ncbi:hypothetical protein [uncultured Roseobacter sp.]|uniref:hypothetical protein n=1 Tax=uncultured Roseobacter sp. TaxID=114847 RepID=UPI002607AB60|nr:hypothetical protein [uncultured Roseobacter sp.]
MKRVFFALMLALAPSLPAADETPAQNPVWMMVAFEVASYDTWRAAFDSDLSLRRDAGELSFEINRFPRFPNQIIAIFKWDSAERAQAFISDPALHASMKAGGVVSKPTITFHEEP